MREREGKRKKAINNGRVGCRRLLLFQYKTHLSPLPISFKLFSLSLSLLRHLPPPPPPHSQLSLHLSTEEEKPYNS
ncbi:hypothetical protein K7X08_009297 [Anisodus acutangulus]|uniref:Uncharacterized protein n=1 Tax=Anisodus acutangulus TaxID=402998 RepID=A0A9Q1N0L4_9SOLA|nr:hypothetical protein K7X08_009297 [Anisodus acutangulus]